MAKLSAAVAHECNTPIQYIADNLLFLDESLDELAALVAAGSEVAAAATADQRERARAAWDDLYESAGADDLVSEVRAAVEEIRDGVACIAAVVEDLGAISRYGEETGAPLPLGGTLEELELLSRSQPPAGVRVRWVREPELPWVHAPRDALRDALWRLLLHVGEAAKRGAASGPQEVAAIARATEQGVGITFAWPAGAGAGSEEAAPTAIDAVGATAEPVHGVASLALVREVLERQCRGQLRLSGQHGHWTRVHVILPACPRAHPEPGRDR